MVRARPLLVTLLTLTAGCASPAAVTGVASEAPSSGLPVAERVPPAADPALLPAAEQALSAGEPARAVALFGQFLASGPEPAGRRQAYLGLATAHERLRDCSAAARTFDSFLEAFPDDPETTSVLMRRGACEADLGEWESSALSYRRALEKGDLLPSVRVEAHAREGFAWFQLDRFEEAEATLKEGERVYGEAADRERFDTYYFVGMNRFYRAAIFHRRFRDVRIRLPKKEMTADYEAKLALLVKAQDAYRDTIRAKHVFWVSAAGFQMGRLFGEFYDSVMYAPIPSWLNDKQRRIYYEELKGQLRPVIDKAVWVFEKNLETARKLGYDNAFIGQSEEKLAHLRAVLLSNEAGLGRPHPRLVPEVVEDVAPPPGAGSEVELPVAERKLFVPLPTPL